MEFNAKFWIRPNKALRNISSLAFGWGKPVEIKGEEKRGEREEEEEGRKEEEKCKKSKGMELCMEISWNLHMFGLCMDY